MMNNNMPRTPLSTQLSKSARETEIRIRNIFSGPKKRPPVLLMALIVLAILLCGNLVAFHFLPTQPTIVMETQYYDTYGNFIEIPMLALPAGEKNEAVEAINQALTQLGKEYEWAEEDIKVDNMCLFYPSTTDRYLNLLFYRDSFSSDLGTGHVLSLVYDLKEGKQVFVEDALALAGLSENALLEQVTQQMEAQLKRDTPDIPLALHELTLEGFRIKADGQPVFYLTAWADDADDSVQDAVSGAGHMYIWEDRTASVYVQYGAMQPPLVPAEETDKLDPPLWNQWYFAREEPAGGFSPGPVASQEGTTSNAQFNEMLLLDYLQVCYDYTAYLPEDIPEEPREGDRCLDSVTLLGTTELEQELLGLYEVRTSSYSQRAGKMEWLQSYPIYLVFRMGANGTLPEPLLAANYYTEGMPIGDAIRQAVWGLQDLEVCLFRDGLSNPIGPGNWVWPMFLDMEIETEAFEEGVSYQPGDFWENWTADGGWNAGGISALRYYSPENSSFSVKRLETCRTDMYTPRGIRVGATREEVLAAYPGLLSAEKNWHWAYPDDYLWYCADENGLGPHLYFFFMDDVVYMIQMVDFFN